MPRIELPNPYPQPVRYAVAIGVATASILLSYALIESSLRLDSAWMLAAVLIAAWFGGMGPGFAATVLCILGQALLRYPEGSWRIEGAEEWAGFTAFIIDAILVCVLFRSHYKFRAWRRVSPVTVSGGYWWTYDTTDPGSIELHSSTFPHITVTRTFSDWLRQIAKEDRQRVLQAIEEARETGKLQVSFHFVGNEGLRLIEMQGTHLPGSETMTAVCLEMGASVPDPQAFLR